MGMEGLTTLQGHYDLEMVRVKEIEERGENPWRIRVQSVGLDWQDLPKV
jgi:hypothetical protein